MWRPLFVVALWLVPPALSQLTLLQQTCQADRRQVSVDTANAHVLLGGLFDVREARTDGIGCGVPNRELIQLYEAARWTISQLNSNSYVPGVRFGLEAYDTCTYEGNAIEAITDFYPQIMGRSGTNESGIPYCRKSSTQYKLGLIGPLQSTVSMAVGQMAPRIPASVISMRSSAPILSDKNLYPTFLRTDQPVSVFARAVTEMFRELKWEKIVIVYVDDYSGMGGYEEVLRAAFSTGVCVAGAIAVPRLGNETEHLSKLQNLASYGATAAVFYGDAFDALNTLKALKNIPAAQNIKWLFSELELETDYSTYPSAQGAIVGMATSTTISAFKTYFTSLNVNSPPAENPWLQDWYMNRYQCKLTGVNYEPFRNMPECRTVPINRAQDYRQSSYLEQTILAVTAYAEAIKQVCSGQSEVCSSLQNMDPLTFHKNYLSKLDVTLPANFPITELRGKRLAFDVNGDPLRSAYTFYNYNNDGGSYTFQQFATYTDGNLQVTTTPTFPRTGSSNLPLSSLCPPTTGCTNCLSPPRRLRLAYKAGDYVVAALINSQDVGQPSVNCGEAIPDRLIEAVAAQYAVANARGLSGRGLSLGYLIVDVCPGPMVARSFLTNLLGGYRLFTDSSGAFISSSNIVAVLDMTREDTGMEVARILASVGLPHIRLAPTSMQFLRNPMYPRLISAIPSQDTVQLALVQMLGALKWNYIQIVSESQGYYYRAATSFRRLASRMNICVGLWSTFDMDPVALVQRMRSVEGAPVVVVFSKVQHMKDLLGAIRTISASPGSQRQLTFVSGSEEWGNSDNIFTGYENEAKGLLSVALSQRSHSGMTSWLNSLSLHDIAEDVFLVEWFERKFSCALTTASRGRYSQVCTTPTSLSGTSVYLGYGPYIVSMVNTVASTLSTILDTYCPGTTGLCPQVRSMDTLGRLLVDSLQDSGDNTEFQIQGGEGMSDMEYFNYKSRTYNRVGGFDTNTRRISGLSIGSITTATNATASSVNTQCTGYCRPCQYSYASQEFGYVPGDWMIAATFSVSNPGPYGQRPYVCGDVRTINGYQFTAAVMYALSRLNSGMGPVKLNNVTLGGLIMDHCSNERRAYGQVADMYSGLTEMTWRYMTGDKGQGQFSPNQILAWLTDTTAATREAAEILQPIGVSIVSPSATAASLLSNPTFFRTVQGDGTAATAIARLCKMLGFKYIQVVHAPNDYGREGLKTMDNVARQEGLCVLNSYEMPNTSSASAAVSTVSAKSTKVVVLFLEDALTKAFLEEAAKLGTQDQLTIISPEPYLSVVRDTPGRQNLRNLLTLQLRSPTLDDFTAFLNDIDRNMGNPFYARYYMKVAGCNLPGYYMYPSDCGNQRLTDLQGYVSSNFALSTINAVYAVAGALQTTLVELCGADYVGECMDFMQSDKMYNRFLENLKLVRFQDPSSRLFQFLEREGNVVYDILRFDGNNFQTIGSYGGASMNLNNAAQLATYYNRVISSCSQECSKCVLSETTFSYTPGDIYLAGIFDVHKQGQGVFECGDINPENGFQLLEAFHFALQQVNSKTGKFADILPGVTLGGIGLDACQKPIRGGYLVSNINNGLTRLKRNGKDILPEEIDAYIGSYSSDSSLYLARILTDLKVPQISYASTSTSLDNQYLYPYFFRTVPADDKQVMGTLRYLDQNNLRYVQILHTTDAYGEMGKTQFDLLIRQYNFSICVAQRVAIPEGSIVSQESSDDVVTELLEKPVANTVVIFASTSHIRAFLQAVARNPEAVQAFKFVGPTTWGDKTSVTEGIPDVADNAVTFALDFQGGVGDFLDSYLTKRNPTNAVNNPWFTEWFEHVLNCYTSPINTYLYPRPCDPNMDLTTKVIEDNVVLHVMNAVYAAAFGLDATLKQKCGENYVTVCELYRSSTDRRTVLRDKLEKVNFTDDTNMPFFFEDREGNKGYKLFKLTSSPLDTDVIYIQDHIGSFSSEGVLQLDMNLVPSYDGSCERQDACVECPTIRNRGVRYAVGGDPDGYITVIGVFDVHNPGTELYQCGSINMEGFQKFLTFWSYDKQARDRRIRLLALDTCSSSLRVGQDLYGLLKNGELCNSDDFDLDKLGMGNIGTVVVTEENNTMSASRILEPLKVPYLSADSVTPLLDDYQYLLRTITPWSGYVRILVKIMLLNGWTYVNSMYVDSDVGREEYMTFQEISAKNKLCLTPGVTLPEDAASDPEIRTALSKLDSSSGAKVVVLFTSPSLTVRVLRQAQERGIANDYLWVFAMGEDDMTDSFPEGLWFQAMVLQPVIPEQGKMEQYISRLTYDSTNSNRNKAQIPRVWWEDYYQTVHSCRLQDALYPLVYNEICTWDKTVSDPDLSKTLHYTSLASLFSVMGLESFMDARCRAGETLQECLTRLGGSHQAIRDHILSLKQNMDGLTYEFVQLFRYIEARYNITLYNVRDGDLNKALYQTYENSRFTRSVVELNKESMCLRSDGCGCHAEGGEAQSQTSFSPTMPRNYYKYNSRDEKLYDWPIWAIVMGVLTGIGLLITVIVFLYLLFFYPVRSGTSVLGYLTMVGIMGVYAINFAFFLHASEATCGARRFVMGVVYVIVFAPLLVKAIDNWRFADLEYGHRPYRGLTSSFTLFLIALGLILVQCIIPIEWLILVHPTASKWTTNIKHDYWWCDPPDMYDIGLVCSFIFVIFIVILTGIFAAFAWDSESNNRESRWILMSAIATAGCFLVWMIVTTNAGPIYRDPAVSIANFVNATLLLIFIPIRKMHLLCQANNDKTEVYAAGEDYHPYNNAFSNRSYDPDGDEDFAYGEASAKPGEDGYNITD